MPPTTPTTPTTASRPATIIRATAVMLAAGLLVGLAGCRSTTVPDEPRPAPQHQRGVDRPASAPGSTSIDDAGATAQPATLVTIEQDGWVRYGEATNAAGLREVGVGEVLENPATYEGQTLRIRGEVSAVCQKRGCWMRLAEDAEAGDDADRSLFVKFTCPLEDQPRLLPMEAFGREAVVEGMVVVEEISEADARHLAEDAGRSPEEIERIEGPQTIVRVMAPNARVAMGR